MVKSIDEVLTPSELDELHLLETAFGNLSAACILEQILHIECSINPTGALQVSLYPSFNNPYQFALRRVQKQYPIIAGSSSDKNTSSAEFSAARQRILHAELSLRTRDIELHKFFVL